MKEHKSNYLLSSSLICDHLCESLTNFCIISHENCNLLSDNDQFCVKITNFTQKLPIMRNFAQFYAVQTAKIPTLVSKTKKN